MRQADELSITIVPAASNFGAHSNEREPPAEEIAMSGFLSTASWILMILYPISLYFISLHTELSEATNNNSSKEKFLSSITRRISLPTSPVAPTTANFIFLIFENFVYRNALVTICLIRTICITTGVCPYPYSHYK